MAVTRGPLRNKNGDGSFFTQNVDTLTREYARALTKLVPIFISSHSCDVELMIDCSTLLLLDIRNRIRITISAAERRPSEEK